MEYFIGIQLKYLRMTTWKNGESYQPSTGEEQSYLGIWKLRADILIDPEVLR